MIYLRLTINKWTASEDTSLGSFRVIAPIQRYIIHGIGTERVHIYMHVPRQEIDRVQNVIKLPTPRSETINQRVSRYRTLSNIVVMSDIYVSMLYYVL